MAYQGEQASIQQSLDREHIQAAFQRFEKTIYPSDAKLFRSLTLKDVWDAVQVIENEQTMRRSLRNTRRIQPLFEGLKTLGNLLDPLCQGVPFLCYIWVGPNST